MTHILDRILDHKRGTEVPDRKRWLPLSTLRARAESVHQPTRDFAGALLRKDGTLALIAEVKRASPSRGIFVPGEFDPAAIAALYASNGAAAISVLTDEMFFKGHLDYLGAVKRAVGVPVLRKDFIVDPYQLYEARVAGADAVLLIVAALDDSQLRDLHSLSIELSLTPLVEVHDAAETARAAALGARVIGVNNRDLRTFVTDIETTARCAATVPAGAMMVSESGIFSDEDVRRVADMGARAILVGESIITAPDMGAQVRRLAAVKIAE